MKAFPYMSAMICALMAYLRDVCWRYRFYRREGMPSRSACIDVSVLAQPQNSGLQPFRAMRCKAASDR